MYIQPQYESVCNQKAGLIQPVDGGVPGIPKATASSLCPSLVSRTDIRHQIHSSGQCSTAPTKNKNLLHASKIWYDDMNMIRIN